MRCLVRWNVSSVADYLMHTLPLSWLCEVLEGGWLSVNAECDDCINVWYERDMMIRSRGLMMLSELEI